MGRELGREVITLGAAALAVWSAIHLLHQYVLLTESYVRAGLF